MDLFQTFKPKTQYVLFAHNFSGHDGFIILNKITSVISTTSYRTNIVYHASRIYSLTIKCILTKTVITFQCSLMLMPRSLDDLAKTFLNTNKVPFPHEFVTKSRALKCDDLETIRTHYSVLNKLDEYENFLHYWNLNSCNNLLDYAVFYCQQDVTILAKVFDMFVQRFTREFLFTPSYKDLISIARLSFTTYYRSTNKHDITNITADTHIDKAIRKAYFGGKTEVFSTSLREGELCYTYDFPSMYGISMSQILPMGPVLQYDLTNVIDYHRYMYSFDSIGLVGFINVDFIAPETIYPVLPIKAKTSKSRGIKLLFCTGKGSGTYYTKEILYSMTIGYKIIRINEVYAFKGGYPLKTHVSELIKLKNHYSNCGDDVLKTIYKMLITNLYGKFGMNIERKTIITSSRDVERITPLKRVSYIDNYAICEVVDPKAGRYNRCTNVALAAAVTSYGRIILHSRIISVIRDNPKARLLYCDTDRIFFASTTPVVCKNM